MRAFIGSYAAEGLAVLDDLTITAKLAVPNASWLAFSADRKYLYAVNEQPAGSVTTVDTETLAVLGQQPTGGDAPTHLSVHGDHLLVANYGSGSVAVLPSTDLVTFPEGSHAHQVVTDPTGRWILAVDIAGNAIHVYELEGKLLPRQRITVPGGPRHLVFHPDGRHAYVVCEYKSQVVVCTWSDGELTAGHAVPTVAPGVVNYPGEGIVSPDGRFLYVTNRGENSIATFTVHDGALTLRESTPTGGDWPRHATLDPTGRHLFVANQRSGTVTWLPRDPGTGALSTMAGSAPVPDVAMVVFA
jgi:6-phosphogluconolactonase (cycloisomerase 2 family)